MCKNNVVEILHEIHEHTGEATDTYRTQNDDAYEQNKHLGIEIDNVAYVGRDQSASNLETDIKTKEWPILSLGPQRMLYTNHQKDDHRRHERKNNLPNTTTRTLQKIDHHSMTKI